MPYISITENERLEMLAEIGVSSFEDLISNIPTSVRLRELLKLDAPMSEIEITKKVNLLAKKNSSVNEFNSFLGGGIYDHYIPAAVDHILLRPEFHTAYTPYQAEVSQGTLQAIYEYQTMICELTGMDISNAGMYDGASAAAEAILMAVRKTKFNKVIVSKTLNPHYLDVIKSYCEGIGTEILYAEEKDGVTDAAHLTSIIDDKTACVLIQTPNYYGNLENMFELEKVIKAYKKTLFVAATDPISLALINSPQEYNADIVIGEGQAMGNHQAFGGPLFGFFATKNDLARMMPGRIVGATVDTDGKRAYCLTLQAREQHIRREKATSNICSNEALCTLAATVYLCLLGKDGLIQVAKLSMGKAHYLAQELCKIEGISMQFQSPFFKEFVVKLPLEADALIKKMHEKAIFPGISLREHNMPNSLLIAVTEKKAKSEMDQFITALKEVLHG